MIRVNSTADTADIVNALLGLARMSRTDMVKASGFTTPQMSKWCRGVNIPTVPVLIRLADAAGFDLVLVPRADASPPTATGHARTCAQCGRGPDPLPTGWITCCWNPIGCGCAGASA